MVASNQTQEKTMDGEQWNTSLTTSQVCSRYLHIYKSRVRCRIFLMFGWFNEYISQACCKACRQLNVLRRIGSFFEAATRLLIYKGFMKSHLSTFHSIKHYIIYFSGRFIIYCCCWGGVICNWYNVFIKTPMSYIKIRLGDNDNIYQIPSKIVGILSNEGDNENKVVLNR